MIAKKIMLGPQCPQDFFKLGLLLTTDVAIRVDDNRSVPHCTELCRLSDSIGQVALVNET